jgi:hypothetical protein
LPSLVFRRPLTFHILIFSSETPHPNELKLGRKQINVEEANHNLSPTKVKQIVKEAKRAMFLGK